MLSKCKVCDKLKFSQSVTRIDSFWLSTACVLGYNMWCERKGVVFHEQVFDSRDKVLSSCKASAGFHK